MNETFTIKIIKHNNVAHIITDVNEYGISNCGRAYYYVKNGHRVFLSMSGVMAIGEVNSMWTRE